MAADGNRRARRATHARRRATSADSRGPGARPRLRVGRGEAKRRDAEAGYHQRVQRGWRAATKTRAGHPRYVDR